MGGRGQVPGSPSGCCGGHYRTLKWPARALRQDSPSGRREDLGARLEQERSILDRRSGYNLLDAEGSTSKPMTWFAGSARENGARPWNNDHWNQMKADLAAGRHLQFQESPSCLLEMDEEVWVDLESQTYSLKGTALEAVETLMMMTEDLLSGPKDQLELAIAQAEASLRLACLS